MEEKGINGFVKFITTITRVCAVFESLLEIQVLISEENER